MSATGIAREMGFLSQLGEPTRRTRRAERASIRRDDR